MRISQLSALNTSRSQSGIRNRDLTYNQDSDIEDDQDLTDEEKKVFITFDLLRSMSRSKIIKYISEYPVFMRTMFVEGKLDPDVIGKISLTLSQSELLKFIQNMTTEINFFSATQTLNTITALEEQVTKLIPIQRMTIWTKMDNSPFLTSSSLTAVLPINETVCGVPFNEPKDYITGDPGDFPNFSVNYDLPIVRGTKSMILLPIYNVNNDVVAVMQCVGMRNELTNEQVEFSQYHFELFKIIRDMVQKKFFEARDERFVPATISTIFDNLEDADSRETINNINKYLMKTIPCEQSEIFEFDDRYRKLIRLSDNESFNESSGGVSFEAGVNPGIVNVPHGHKHPSFNNEIDGNFANRSILAKSLQKGRSHFVLTLRAKPNRSSFSNSDAKMIAEISPIICDAIKASRFVEKQKKTIQQLTHEKELMSTAVNTLSSISANGVDRYKALVDTAKHIFGCETLFVCVFDGRYMRYYPTQITAKFEESAAGQAYNYREAVWTNEKDAKQKYSPLLYDQLKVKRKTTVCFPYRSGGRVVGSIELINPNCDKIDKEEERLIGNICGATLHDFIVSWMSHKM